MLSYRAPLLLNCDLQKCTWAFVDGTKPLCLLALQVVLQNLQELLLDWVLEDSLSPLVGSENDLRLSTNAVLCELHPSLLEDVCQFLDVGLPYFDLQLEIGFLQNGEGLVLVHLLLDLLVLGSQTVAQTLPSLDFLLELTPSNDPLLHHFLVHVGPRG